MTESYKEFVYGAEGSGLYFKIIVTDDGSGNLTASVVMLEGSMDLNALWFSDGDDVGDEFGDTELGTNENALNMEGATYDVGDDGTQDTILWDGLQIRSLPGLGPDGEEKSTFLSAGDEPYTFDLNFSGSLEDLNYIGVRATSVNGGDSIKLIDEGELVEPPPPVDEFCFSGLTRGAWGTPDNGAGVWDDGYTTDQSLEAVFGIDSFWSSPGKGSVPMEDATLLQALGFSGGGQNQLMAQAVAALLNSADGSTGNFELQNAYRFSTDEITSAVQWAFGLDADIDGDGDLDVNDAEDNVYNAEFGNALKDVLDYWNNANNMDADGDGVEDGEICIELPSGETPMSLFDTVFEIL